MNERETFACYLHREVAATLALGVKSYLVGRDECMSIVAAFTIVLHFRRYFCDNIIDGNGRGLQLMAIVRDKEVTGLKDHARLIIHACVK